MIFHTTIFYYDAASLSFFGNQLHINSIHNVPTTDSHLIIPGWKWSMAIPMESNSNTFCVPFQHMKNYWPRGSLLDCRLPDNAICQLPVLHTMGSLTSGTNRAARIIFPYASWRHLSLKLIWKSVNLQTALVYFHHKETLLDISKYYHCAHMLRREYQVFHKT